MSEAQCLALVTSMTLMLEAINQLKAEAKPAEARCLAIAATNLETSMLWVANARQ